MRHLPNIICLCRIALIWPIVDSLLGGSYERTLLLFGVAALSDGLDGWLAKRYGWTSRLGIWLDPLADKLLLVSVFLVLTWRGDVPRYLAVSAIGRDVLIALGAVVFQLAWGPVRGRPILSSKINTVLQILYVLLLVTHAAWAQPPSSVLQAMAALICVTVLYSGVAYLREFTQRALHVAAQP
ncbi:MAG TPA: CDP-alcohol phosphatidyltransferase family protein [Steroidobacteraceae bacterium]|nr:CDP-alcohol phosphatidyltransferase family protein [Steroidobacteraceae bacterium]